MRGPEVGLPGANIIAETSEYVDNEELGRESAGDVGRSLEAEVGLGGAKTMLGRSSRCELEGVKFMLEGNITGADGRRANKVDKSCCG